MLLIRRKQMEAFGAEQARRFRESLHRSLHSMRPEGGQGEPEAFLGWVLPLAQRVDLRREVDAVRLAKLLWWAELFEERVMRKPLLRVLYAPGVSPEDRLAALERSLGAKRPAGPAPF